MSLSAFLLLMVLAVADSPAERCIALAVEVADEPIIVSAVEAVPASDDLPAYCRVRGTIEPSIGFEARLPLHDWNGKYFQTGCGGFCGLVLADKKGRSNAVNHAVKRGYAAITTDGGHQGAHIGDVSWAKDNPEAEVLFAHRAIPLTHSAGRALVNAYYGEDPRHDYFSGCSNGGRMALIAAQRYPNLFDGIISGCPVLDLAGAGGVFGAWVLQANSDDDGGAVLDASFAEKLPYLEALVEEQCDGLDGAVDGLIAAPEKCVVDLDAAALCNTGEEPCLTPEEKDAVVKWYRGPHNSAGEQLFAGMPPGSERFWKVWYLGDENGAGPGMFLADGYGRNLAFPADPENYSPLDFNFDEDVEKLAAQGALFNALDPDLASFRDAGGKLLLWHGMADPLVTPQQSVDYYHAVVEEFAGAEEVQSFFRLFLAPGVGHCWEAPGAGPDDFDLLKALENWVEKGVAPDAIEATPSKMQKELKIEKARFRPYPASAEIITDRASEFVNDETPADH